MADFKVTGIGQFDSFFTHFALFTDYKPTSFKSVVKESKWCKAIDEEIAAVERYNTWEFTELPKRPQDNWRKVDILDQTLAKWRG